MNTQMPTQLVNAEKQGWDRELPDKLGIPANVIGSIYSPQTVVVI